MGRTRRTVAGWSVCGALALTLGISGSQPAAAVDSPTDTTFTHSSAVAGADVGFMWSKIGPSSSYGASNIRFTFPPGFLFAHEDSHAGVPPSPIANRPVAGDIIGANTLIGEFVYLGCGVVRERNYRMIWNGDWSEGSPEKVAEVGLLFEDPQRGWQDYTQLYGIRLDVLLTSAVGAPPIYELSLPTTAATGLFCPGSTFRQVGNLTAPAGKAIARNPETPGVHRYCESGTSLADGPFERCRDIALTAPDTSVAVATASADCTIVGTSGNDLLQGTAGNDVICGGGGNDTLVGGAGNDIIVGGAGNDRISGGDGDDAVDGGAGKDVVDGGLGNDKVFGGNGNDVLSDGAGDDVVQGGVGNDRLSLDTGDDIARGDSGNDTITGSPGNDVVAGGEGDDTLAGGIGSDLVYGASGTDTCEPEPIIDLGAVIEC